MERYPSARECIHRLGNTIAAQGGGGFVFAKRGDHPFILLRKLGKLWPEADKYVEGSPYPLKLTFLDGRPAKLVMVELSARKRRRRRKRNP